MDVPVGEERSGRTGSDMDTDSEQKMKGEEKKNGSE